MLDQLHIIKTDQDNLILINFKEVHSIIVKEINKVIIIQWKDKRENLSISYNDSSNRFYTEVDNIIDSYKNYMLVNNEYKQSV